MVFLELLVRVIVESAFYRVHLFGVVFLVLIVTFLEKVYLSCIIQQEFRNIAFYKVVFCNYMLVLFLDKFGSVYFLYYEGF